MTKHPHIRRRTSTGKKTRPAILPAAVNAPTADAITCESDLLAQFSDSIALLTVTHASLASKELTGTGDEEVALRHVLAGLKAVYNGLDGSLARTGR